MQRSERKVHGNSSFYGDEHDVYNVSREAGVSKPNVGNAVYFTYKIGTVVKDIYRICYRVETWRKSFIADHFNFCKYTVYFLMWVIKKKSIGSNHRSETCVQPILTTKLSDSGSLGTLAYNLILRHLG